MLITFFKFDLFFADTLHSKGVKHFHQTLNFKQAEAGVGISMKMAATFSDRLLSHGSGNQ